jgi:uncharacterized membrane protein
MAMILPGEAVQTVREWLSDGPYRWALAIIGVLTLPLLTGWTSRRFVYPMLAHRREWRAYFDLEQNLVTELAPDEDRGYAIVIVDWPSSDVATVGVLAATTRGPDGELAAVYFPDAPNPGKGSIRMVHRDKLRETDWTLRDFLNFYMSYGSAVRHPVAPGGEPTGGPTPKERLAHRDSQRG